MNARSPILALALFATTATVACDGGPTGGNALQPNRALYAAGLTLDGRVGAIRVQDGGTSVDLLEMGALVEIRFENDRSIVGRLIVPAGIPGAPVDVEFGGTWDQVGGEVRVNPSIASFLGELDFAVDPGRLTADGTVDGRRFEITLESVAASDPTLVAPAFPVLDVVDVQRGGDMQAFWGEVVVESEADRTIAVALQACPAFLRARPEGENEVVWDQAIDQGCDGSRRLLILEPGESVLLRTPDFDVTGFLETEPEGFYDFFVVFPVNGEEIETEIEGRNSITS